MKNTNKKEGGAQGSSGKKGKEVPVKKLPKLEMYAVLGLDLGKTVLAKLEQFFEKLEQVEKAVEILATQKARELNPDEPREKEDQ